MCLQSCSPLCLYAPGCSASTPILDPQGGAGRIIPKGEITGQLLDYTSPAVPGLDAWRPTKPAPGGGPALGGIIFSKPPSSCSQGHGGAAGTLLEEEQQERQMLSEARVDSTCQHVGGTARSFWAQGPGRGCFWLLHCCPSTDGIKGEARHCHRGKVRPGSEPAAREGSDRPISRAVRNLPSGPDVWHSQTTKAGQKSVRKGRVRGVCVWRPPMVSHLPPPPQSCRMG